MSGNAEARESKKPAVSMDGDRRDFLRGATMAGAALVAVAGGMSVEGCCRVADLEEARRQVKSLTEEVKTLTEERDRLSGLVGSDTYKELENRRLMIESLRDVAVVKVIGNTPESVRIELEGRASERVCEIWKRHHPQEVSGRSGEVFESRHFIPVVFGVCGEGKDGAPEGNKVNLQCSC
jgi:hypothetical protein